MRLEAIRMGEIEKAKAEAEHQARLQQMHAQQAHEQQLAALHGDESKKRLKLIVGVVSAVLVISIGSGAYVMKQRADETRKQQLAFAAEQERRDQELKRLKADFDSAQKKQKSCRSRSRTRRTRRHDEAQTELAQAKADTEEADGRAQHQRGSGSGTIERLQKIQLVELRSWRSDVR